MNAPDQTDLAEAEAAAKGRKFYSLEVAIGDESFYMIAAKPKKADYIRFMTEIQGAATPAKLMRAQETFVLSCRLWPEEKTLKDLFEEEIGLSGSFGTFLIEKLGLEAKATTQGQ